MTADKLLAPAADSLGTLIAPVSESPAAGRGRLVWRAGHRVGEATFEFPHLCPGDNCAIGAWCVRMWSLGRQ